MHNIFYLQSTVRTTMTMTTVVTGAFFVPPYTPSPMALYKTLIDLVLIAWRGVWCRISKDMRARLSGEGKISANVWFKLEPGSSTCQPIYPRKKYKCRPTFPISLSLTLELKYHLGRTVLALLPRGHSLRPTLVPSLLGLLLQTRSMMRFVL
jgi:hypothetical protein